jgi:homoserine kinase type II
MDNKETDYRTILFGFGLEFGRMLNINMQGSPERSIFRTVVEDGLGKKYILEQISARQMGRRRIIAEMLSELKAHNLNVEPYLRNKEDKYILENEGRHYHIARFIEGKVLQRPEYAKEGWRGKELAQFLLKLRKLNIVSDKDLDIKAYVKEISATLKKNHPHIYEQIVPVLDFLDNGLFKVIDNLPVSFCHGDYHPINVIWGEDRIKSVIDWEFFGAKPEFYDAANMLGCVGMENPDYLTEGLATAFVSELRKGDFAAESWEYLVDLIIANRFAWLSEWCRKDDREMQELEVVYMRLLIGSRKELMRGLGI